MNWRTPLLRIFPAAVARCGCTKASPNSLEPRSLSSEGHQLSSLFKAQRDIPLNVLEGSFMNFSGAQAYVAYAESLAAVSYINDTYGMSDIQRILHRIGQGTPPKPHCGQRFTPTTASSNPISAGIWQTNTAKFVRADASPPRGA